MTLPPGREPPDGDLNLHEPAPDAEHDTRPLNPVRKKEGMGSAGQPNATVLRGVKGVKPAGLASSHEQVKDTERVRLVPRLKNPPPWRVIFLAGDPPITTMGIDVRQALVIGRADSDDEFPPGLDLSDQGALEHGISHQHAVLIPTRDGLYLSDLGSKNGTWVNGQYLEPGLRYRLAEGNVLELGLLKLRVRSVTQISRSST